jgi:spore coat protein U-like protein
MQKILPGIAAALALAAPALVAANTKTANFAVKATLLKSCSVHAAAVAFGAYTPGGGPITNAGSAVTLNCTRNTTYTVALNRGSTAGGTIAQRLMGNGANKLEYNLYTTAALTTVWGNGTGTSVTQAGTGAGMSVAATPYTLYAELPDNAANKNVPPGAYTDTVTVTVTY